MPFASPEFEAQWTPLVTSEVNGYEVRVMHHQLSAYTDTPVVLMMHGLEEVWQVWLPMAERLLGRFRIFAVDLPWRAHNDYGWSETLLPSQWLAEVMDVLPVVPDAIVGHSFGSNATLEYLAKPGAAPVSSAILTSPAYRSSTQGLTWRMMDESLASFKEILTAGLRVRADQKDYDPEIFSRMVDKISERVGPNGFVNLFRLFAHSPFIRLENVTCPTLVIGGKKDPTSTATGVQALAAGLPNGSLELLDPFDHFCEVEQADEVSALTAAHVLAYARPRQFTAQAGPHPHRSGLFVPSPPTPAPTGPVSQPPAHPQSPSPSQTESEKAEEPVEIKVGQMAPDFTLNSHRGERITLSAFQGEKNVLLVFFPFAFSGVCTGELCSVRDELPRYQNEDVQVLAISTDPVFSQIAWAEKEGYEFPLLSDFWPHGTTAQAYGVFDESFGIATRGTFLIDREGVVRFAEVNGPSEARDQTGWLKAIAEL